MRMEERRRERVKRESQKRGGMLLYGLCSLHPLFSDFSYPIHILPLLSVSPTIILPIAILSLVAIVTTPSLVVSFTCTLLNKLVLLLQVSKV